MAKISSVDKNNISPKIQIIFILITSLILSYGLYFATRQYYSVDSKKLHERASEIPEKGIPVHVTIDMQDISKLDIIKGLATFDLLISFKYEKLKKESNFEISNLFFFKYSSIKEKYLVTKYQEGIYEIEVWRTIIDSSLDLNYKLFPIDDHLMKIFLCTTHPLVYFITDNSSLILPRKSEFSSWHVVKNESSISHVTTYLGHGTHNIYASEVDCVIALNKVGYRGVLSIFMPLCVILFIALFTLSVTQSSAFNLIISLMLTLNAFRIVLERLSPRTSYMLFSDLIFLAVLLITFIIFIMHAIPELISKRFCYIVMFVSHIGILLLFYYYLRVWI